MEYGKSIGSKFYEDGRVRRFPGNTMVADITPECPAYQVMTYLRQQIIDNSFDETIILLPENSYHMTVIQGLNDQTRDDTRWPKDFSRQATMEEADDYFTAAASSIPMIDPPRMKFDQIVCGQNACVVRLKAADEEQEKTLRTFRDKIADALKHRQPTHDTYRFHISLGYMRFLHQGAEKERLDALLAKLNEYLAQQPAFTIGKPYIAYFDDMMFFHENRIPRD